MNDDDNDDGPHGPVDGHIDDTRHGHATRRPAHTPPVADDGADDVVCRPTAFHATAHGPSHRRVVEEILNNADGVKRVVVIIECDDARLGFGHSEMTDKELWWMLTQTVARLQKSISDRYSDVEVEPPSAA